jgi:hypothetical protein
MAQVLIPQKKDDTNNLLTIGGAVVGGIMGGPPGAMLGAQAGGLAGSTLNPEKAGPAPVQATVAEAPSATDSNAVRRRLDSLNQNPVQQLTAAQEALKYQPKETQKQYMDTINQALILAQRDQRRGMA